MMQRGLICLIYFKQDVWIQEGKLIHTEFLLSRETKCCVGLQDVNLWRPLKHVLLFFCHLQSK